jgi:hypothetical protein
MADTHFYALAVGMATTLEDFQQVKSLIQKN